MYGQSQIVVLQCLCLTQLLKFLLVLVSDAGVPGLLGVVFLHRAVPQLVPCFASNLGVVRNEVLLLEL